VPQSAEHPIERQSGVAPLHTTPQAPQFEVSVAETVQSAAEAGQRSQPDRHSQLPFEHASLLLQERVHDPQWALSLVVLTSQPFIATESQSAKPAEQPHIELLHDWLGPHAVPQAPQ
jgi:hypothetical protein